MAAPLPKKIAFFCWFGGSPRAAIAMTTALSPDSSTLAKMMEPRAAQKSAVRRMSTGSRVVSAAGAKEKEPGGSLLPARSLPNAAASVQLRATRNPGFSGEARLRAGP